MLSRSDYTHMKFQEDVSHYVELIHLLLRMLLYRHDIDIPFQQYSYFYALKE